MSAILHHAAAVHDGPFIVFGFILACLVLVVINRQIGRKPARIDHRNRRDPEPIHSSAITQGFGSGLEIGRAVDTGEMLRATFDSVVVMVAGARTGTTTTVAVPSILDAPGPVLATSNKGDLVAATRGIRAQLGPVWLFDPQGLAGTGDPAFWWDPLDSAGTVWGARALASLFADAASAPGSPLDASFDPESRELLAMLLLAAAVGSRPLTAVYGWLGEQHDDEPAALLAAAGLHLGGDEWRGGPGYRRGEVYRSAQAMVSWLADPALTAWVVDPRDGRPRLDAETFTDKRATLYSLSKEGPGSAGALTLALTAAVLAAAERKAARSPDGRLPVPLVAVLDEVANVARWQQLPDLCSRYGSRGIVIMSFLQSWSQAVECWGREGARTLWSSASVRVYGGGVPDPDFLSEISDLCGEQDFPSSAGRERAGPWGTSTVVRRRAGFDVETLAALPPGRAVVIRSGARPALVRIQSRYDGLRSAEIRRAVAG